MRARIFLATLALTLIGFPVAAQREALEVGKIFNQQQQIRSGVQAGTGRYKDMPQSTRNQLLTKQDDLFSMLDGKRTTDELSEQQKIQAFNTLEWIEATVNQAEDEQMVCERRPILGSNRKERVCRTMAQMKREREQARIQMESSGICSDCKGN